MKENYVVTNRELSWMDFNFRVLRKHRMNGTLYLSG